MTTYLVTGGAGFIGSHLVEALLNRPDTKTVRVLDDLSTGHRHNLAPVMAKIQFMAGDLRDEACLAQAVAGVDIIFHLAAQVSVPKSMVDPLTTHAINATGTLKLLQAAQQAGVRRLVNTSTCAVYGDEPTLPKMETMRPEPKSPYAVAKLAAEGYCQHFTTYHHLETVTLRYFNVYGPRQDPSSAYSGIISILIDRLANDQPVTIYGDGEQTRDFVYVGDVVMANLLAAEQTNAAGKTFNIGTKQATSINQLYDLVSRLLDKPTKPTYGPAREGDIRHSWTDPQQAEQILGWRAETALIDGLREIIA